MAKKKGKEMTYQKQAVLASEIAEKLDKEAQGCQSLILAIVLILLFNGRYRLVLD
jgi:hypothetical protein